MRFKEFIDNWRKSNISNEFIFLTNNSLSRDDLNYNSGYRKNIHYGDILTKFATVKNINDTDVPYINSNIKLSNGFVKLISGDIIVADTAEDYTVGKAIEIYNPNSLEIYSGLHTIPLRPKNKFSIGYLAYYFNSYIHKKRIYPLIQGIKVYSISKSALSNSIIKFPSLEEQEKIAQILTKIDERIFTQKKIIDRKISLMYSIINLFLRDKTTNKKLSNVAEIVKGKQINGDNFSDDYEYEVYNGGTTSSGKYSSFNSEKCISISEGGNSCGFVNYIEERFWSGGHNYTLNVKNEVNDKYLFFILKAKEKQLMDLRVGSGLPNIQKSSLQNFNIYIPSLAEQNYIAKVLSSLYSYITNEKRILELYQKQKDYLLNKMFI